MRAQVEGLNYRIRELFYSRDESMLSIARKAGMSKNAIYTWINDESCPGAASIAQICKYFNVSADWLLGLSDRKERT